MRRSLLIIFLAILAPLSNAQVRVRDLPLPGYEQRIRDFVDSLKIVDTHEHLFNPLFISKSTLIDFMLLLQHFSYDDFVSAGLPKTTFNMLVGDSLTVPEKWNIIKPFWDASRNTGYNRVALIAARDLFGVNDLNSLTVDKLSENIKNAYKTDWFSKLIVEKCRISSIILDAEDRTFVNDHIFYVKRFNNFLNIRTKYTVDSTGMMQGKMITSLEELVKSLETSFIDAVSQGIVAIKINIAYKRPLSFENVPADQAKKVFRELMSTPEHSLLQFEKIKPLQDYMLYRLLDLAKSYQVPVVIHTGLQAGNGNFIENAKPTLLTRLFIDYPDVNFVLYHGAYPYGGELAALAKNFKNVSIDLCWLYAISPSYSERYLSEWLETVPVSKIMAFGGDYNNIENVYGELVIAKEIILRVLSQKVRDGFFSESEAKIFAKMILHDNAAAFYNIP